MPPSLANREHSPDNGWTGVLDSFTNSGRPDVGGEELSSDDVDQGKVGCCEQLSDKGKGGLGYVSLLCYRKRLSGPV